MDFSKLKVWMKKMNQILELYQDNEEFTSTEKELLLDYTRKMKAEIDKLRVDELEEENTVEEIIQPIIVSKTIASKSPTLSTTPTQESVNKETVSIPIETSSSNVELFPELFDHLEVVDVYSKLELKPLSDIKLGMGLNEKILAQNELFNGDKTAFEDTIQKLNSCTDFLSAKKYLCDSVIPIYNWVSPTKEKTVNSFIKLVKRRHL
ncbi:MAG: hypothetical protein HOP11_03320 [Saprospiraceae bacterium]|nr:hypothetical protein [Saprospiraceae bacterium]